MYLELTEEQQFIQQTAARFAADELLPVAEILDRGEGRDLLLTNLQKLANLGFMGLNIDSDYGGTEAGSVAFSVALTELGRGCASTAVTVSVTNMVAEVIQACGTEQQKQHYLPKLCSGEYPAGAFCLTESGAGSDPAGMKCRATKEGNDWLLNGTKLYITSAEFAGLFVVWAVTDPQAKKGKKLGVTDSLIGAVEIMSQQIGEMRPKANPPDLYLHPQISGFEMLDFFRAEAIFKNSAAVCSDLKRALQQLN